MSRFELVDLSKLATVVGGAHRSYGVCLAAVRPAGGKLPPRR